MPPDTPTASHLHHNKGLIRGMLADMGRQVAVVLYVMAMLAVIVGVDFQFFRNQFWERLIVNIALSGCLPLST